MGDRPVDDLTTLQQAAERAERLLAHLLRDRTDLLSPDFGTDVLSPGLLAEGQAALQRAASAADRLALTLRASAAAGPDHPPPDDLPQPNP